MSEVPVNPALETVDTTPAPAPPAPPQFVGTKPRSEVVMLDWPLEYDGKLYDRVTVRRMSTQEVAQFMERIAERTGEDLVFPMYDAPDAVINALDDDDAERVADVVNRFMPRRFRVAREELEHPDGDDTLPS